MEKAKQKEISIITPTFNSEKYLQECLDSVRNQNGEFQLQHIIVDGSSKDNTMRILRDYSDSVDYEVKIISGKDKNMYDAINKGMKHVKGDIWACLNSDDMYLPNTLAIVVDFFKKNPEIEAAYGIYDAIDSGGRFLYRRFLPRFRLKNLIDLKGSAIMPQPTTFMRKRVINKVGYFNINYNFASDYDYQIRMGSNCNVRRLKKVLTKFRKHSGTITSRESSQRKESDSISEKYSKGRSIINRRIIGLIKLYLINMRIINIPFIFRKIIGKKGY